MWERLYEDLRSPSVMIVIKPSRKIRIKDPTRATYSRLGNCFIQLLLVTLDGDPDAF